MCAVFVYFYGVYVCVLFFVYVNVSVCAVFMHVSV